MSNETIIPIANSEQPDTAISGATHEQLNTVIDAATSTSQPWSFEQLSTFIDAGGPVIMILMLMSVIGLAVLLLKLWQFTRLQLNNRDFIDKALAHWRTGEYKGAVSILQQSRNPIARVMETAMMLKKSQAEDTLAREEVTRIATNQLSETRSFLRIIEVIATLSPLLGLLGTVLGMIEAFQRMEMAGSAVDPSVLSGGIWEALLTTAAGLSVAIPAVVALTWLEQRIQHLKQTMEDAMTRVFTSHLVMQATEYKSSVHEEILKPEIVNVGTPRMETALATN